MNILERIVERLRREVAQVSAREAAALARLDAIEARLVAMEERLPPPGWQASNLSSTDRPGLWLSGSTPAEAAQRYEDGRHP